MANYRQMAEEIFRASIAAVQPDELIRQRVSVCNGVLKVPGIALDLAKIKNIYVVGAGKASAFMAREVETMLGNRVSEGRIVVKYGHACPLEHVNLTEAGHPMPDAAGVLAAADILRIAKQAQADDLVLCLLSGGASVLLADYPDGAQLEDMVMLNRLLVYSGADIVEINAVRKHLSKIKGGQLARAAWPATMITLILSDVIGDPLDVIASGPSVPDPTTFADALKVVRKFGLESKMPPVLLKHLMVGIAGRADETPKPGDFHFDRTQNIVIGNNQMALEAGRKKAAELGFEARIAGLMLSGDVSDMAHKIVTHTVAQSCRPRSSKDVCLLFGGETTIKVAGHGLGGRNQHLALAAAIELADKPGITVLCAGSDGTDGPTDAAGAIVDCRTVPMARARGLDPDRFLKTFDSYHFFKNAGGHVVTGPTMTNVMDIALVLSHSGHTHCD